MHDNEKMKY